MSKNFDTYIASSYAPRGVAKALYSYEFRFPLLNWGLATRQAYILNSEQKGASVADARYAYNPEEVNIFTTRMLDQRLSELADASKKAGRMTLAEVIRRAQRGEFGSTEVKSNQVW